MGSAWWQCAACLRTQEEDICELQLNHCNLYDVPPDVFIYERTLEKLFLDANRIKDLPRPLFQCHELRVLSLSDNEVGTLPPAIASLINLEHLDLSKNTIKELPDSIKECKNLQSIDISVNPFERFPDAITHIVGLRELYLNDAYIEYLPANFGRLSSLKTLELRENNMMTLPKSMSRLVNLQRLDIGNNDFTELPEVVGDLINLTELWIDGNDIRRIPTNIEQLVRLNHFDCTMNAVHLMPSEIQGWRDISIMNLSSNEIYQLPDSLCYLQTVVTLKIDDNQLNALPDEIGQMSSLEELIVTKNFLEYLPPSIGLLRKLHCLNADNNYLRSLPPEIGSCSALSLLSLRSNNLSKIPPELGHLASLRVLNLVNNCIKFLPVSMLNLNCLKALWLSDNQSQPLVPLQQEFNCEEDIMVLSCFMLPQKPRQDIEQMEQPVGPLTGTVPGSGRRICFAAEVESEGPRQLHRAPTPYPKELRNLARHARNLHHQSNYNQQSNLEPETTIREAIVTKATASLSILSNSGSLPHQSPSGKNFHPPSTPDGSRTSNHYHNNDACEVEANRVYSEESSDEANKIVLAEEKSPDIREAKCIRNPSSEYIKQPTVADYVNSTWKPDEYSKANIAKIIESEKFAEPYRSTPINGDKGINHFGIDGFKVNDVPPLPPPYHIAAAFSKKAMLFQQINNATTEPQILPSKVSSLSSLKFDQPLNLVNQNNKAITSPGKEKSFNRSKNDNTNAAIYANELAEMQVDIIEKTVMDKRVSVDTVDNPLVEIEETLNSSDLLSENDQSLRPSKIPILKQKYFDDDSLNKYTNSVETNDSYKSLSLSSTPTSPITGKKYRVPLSSRTKPVASSKKFDNGLSSGKNESESRNVNEIDQQLMDKYSMKSNSSNNLKDDVKSLDKRNDNLENNHSLIYTLDDNLPVSNKCAVKIQNDTIISGRNTSTATSKSFDNANASINAKSKIPTLTNSPSPERKPRLKWMFGPHKNANVFPVQVRKNPGLGFSIAGGVAGAETGIIVTKVNPDGPAQGTLRPGDKILEVDGVDFTKMDHDKAVSVLRATNPVVSMMISRHQ
ncbi:protein lap1 isoform X1 [Neodiprion fabricii]|uniref:protein lap1 isoform X1 n=1 Tax=Neodiprion fabricii TaxID=2872261 RepID=UPI001ED90B34|nr:protein lap1 isoform X1 [Neodiprion fabricii]XP_046426606.1 protein lap1 isoform X1 [Neodiprion fabricii]XP_046426607.1 protein lap1 isoform X1 [Neodiprion fabricii]XP_046426608.1 protein lap1 isoform X1 [Neodiprion fabricii]XP_046426609.1 protein lap1 isoform X1 [Neodiprion fabricii]